MKYLIFLQVIRVFKFLLIFVKFRYTFAVPWQTRKYIRSFSMAKRLKSTVLQPF